MKCFLAVIIFLVFLSFQSISAQNPPDERKKSPVCNGAALLLPVPKYPKTNVKIVSNTNSVLVQISIDENGNVVEAKALSGHPLLRIEAEKAALAAEFKPYKRKNQMCIGL